MTCPGAGAGGLDHAGCMSAPLPVIVHPPSPTGGRRVRVDGVILGLAYNVRDLVEFLRRAGMDIDPMEVAVSPLIDWRGGGPEEWGPQPRA